jgi:hypothetical protein
LVSQDRRQPFVTPWLQWSFVIDSLLILMIYADFLYDHLTLGRLPFYTEYCSDNGQIIGDFLKYSTSKLIDHLFLGKQIFLSTTLSGCYSDGGSTQFGHFALSFAEKDPLICF